MATVTFYTTKDATGFYDVGLASGAFWSGWDDHHPVGEWVNSYRARAHIYFPIDFSGIVTLTSVKMYLKQVPDAQAHATPSNGTSVTIHVNRMVRDWGEATNHGEAVWYSGMAYSWTKTSEQTYNGQTNWVTEGQLSKTFTENGNAWHEFDITDIAQAWFDHYRGLRTDAPNYGVILRNNEETNSSKGLDFYARDHSTENRPYVVVEYSLNQAPNAPTSLSPTGDQILNTLTPTFTGNFSDPDAGDTLSAVQIKVFEDNGTTLKWDSGSLSASGTSFSKLYGGTALTGNRFYKWQARTKDEADWGPYSALQRFKVNTVPNAPTTSLQESPTTDVLTLTPTFQITHSDNDPSDGNMYAYQIILELSNGTAVWDSGLIDTSGAPVSVKSHTYDGPALSWQTSYRWRARTKDSNGAVSNYSSNKTFTTHTTSAPTSLSPTASEVVGSITPTFSGARGNTNDILTSLQVEVYADDGQTLVWDSNDGSSGVSSTTFSRQYAGTTLSGNTFYKWRARVTSSIGGQSAWSSMQRFKTPASDAPTQTAPVGTGHSLTPDFEGTWSQTLSHVAFKVFEEDGTTLVWDSGDIDEVDGTSYDVTYSGPTLEWNTTYKWQVRVKRLSDGTYHPNGGYTGLTTFKTDSAGVPTLTSPAANAWITDSTPDLQGSAAGADTISQFRILLYESDGSTLKWDSGDLSGSGTTFSKTYDGPELTGGNSYQWQARYSKSSGAIGDYSAKRTFRLNGSPSAPTGLSPASGHTFDNDLTPDFTGTFVDPDTAGFGDEPTKLTLEVRRVSDDVEMNTVDVTSGLVAGANTITYDATGGTALSKGVEYKWRIRYEDSKNAVGAWSSFRTFMVADAPSVTIDSPGNGSNLTATSVPVEWTFSDPNSLAQLQYRVQVFRNSNQVQVYDSGIISGDDTEFTIPHGKLTANNTDYDIKVTVWNAGNLSSSDTNTATTNWDAPPAITGLSPTSDEENSRITLEWDESTVATGFVQYTVYRKLVGEDNWTAIAEISTKTTTFYDDYYAGQRQQYQYKVTQSKAVSGGPAIESPDGDIVVGELITDEWIAVGADRDGSHIANLPVIDEEHQRPVQQEVFEPVGSQRKVIARGFVLGHEGSLQLFWPEEEAADAKLLLEYLFGTQGPHILKSPFGDVWDVEFSGPSFKYAVGGHLNVSISFVEIGQNTSSLSA